jgi:hypothetical protein
VRVLKAAVIFLAMTGLASAQAPVVIDFGIRGGLTMGPTFRDNPNCCHVPFPTVNQFADETSPGTFGPTVSVLLQDRFEFRFEAVRKRPGYRHTNGLLVGPSAGLLSTVVWRGHSWEYPVLLTYHLFPGSSFRFFAGGGAGAGSMHSTITTQVGSSSAQITDDSSVPAWYGIGGFERRMSLFSIRPEVRFRRYFEADNELSSVRRELNQMEFLVGITIHPFQRKPIR